MSEDKSISLINLGGLSKAADTLITKVSAAIGGMFGPWQVKRLAKAEAEASLVKAKAEIEITDLHRRAMHRFVEEEAKRQENMEKITEKAILHLHEGSDPSKMEDDWVTNFFDKSRIVSDGEMQSFWAKVLAGEANTPGTYSKRTVNFLADLDKRDAELFQTLCGFGWHIDNIFNPLVFEYIAPVYNDNGINFESLMHLNSIGLIQFNHSPGFSQTELPMIFKAQYGSETLILKMKKDKDNDLSIGRVLLTQVGKELSHVCQPTCVDGFFDYIKNKWKVYLLEETTEPPN